MEELNWEYNIFGYRLYKWLNYDSYLIDYGVRRW